MKSAGMNAGIWVQMCTDAATKEEQAVCLSSNPSGSMMLLLRASDTAVVWTTSCKTQERM